MKILAFTDSRGQHRPAGSSHRMFPEMLQAHAGCSVDLLLCPFKWTTTLDFLASFTPAELARFDAVVLYTGIVDWSPRKWSNARDDLYAAAVESNLDGLRHNTLDYARKIVNRKKPIFDEVFGKDAMARHMRSPFDVLYEGEPTLNMYSLEMAERSLLPRLQAVPNLVFVNANRFVAGWRGDYPRERPSNMAVTHAYSDLFSRGLHDRLIDLRVWDDGDVKRFTCDNLHLSEAGNEYVHRALVQRLQIGRAVHAVAPALPSTKTSKMAEPKVEQAAPAADALLAGLVVANRAYRAGDAEGAFRKALGLFRQSGRASHFHTALLAARQTGKADQLAQLFEAARQAAEAVVSPESGEDEYLRRFAFLLPRSVQQRIAEVARRPLLSEAELAQLEERLRTSAEARAAFIEARDAIVRTRLREDFRYVQDFPLPFPYNYLSDYLGNTGDAVPDGAVRPRSVTFIYPIKNRSRRAAISLRSLAVAFEHLQSRDLPPFSVDVVLVEDEGPDRMDPAVLSGLPFDVSHVVVRSGVSWTRSGLLNEGLRTARGALVVFVDADVLFPPVFLENALRAFEAVDTSRTMFAFNMFETHSHRKEGLIHAAGMPYSYMWALLRKHALAVGGFNEGYVGWGSEDRDFEFRVCRKAGLRVVSSGGLPFNPYVLHLSHDLRTGSEAKEENKAKLQAVRSAPQETELVVRPQLAMQVVSRQRHRRTVDVLLRHPSLALRDAERRRRTLVIMGNGPSLGEIMNDPRLLELVRTYDTFGLNAAYRAYDRYHFYPTYFGSFDFRVCDSHAQAFSELVGAPNGIKRFFFAKQSVFDEATCANPRFQRIGFRAAPKGVSQQTALSASFDDFQDCGSSGTNAVQAGYLMGYRHFILLGVDCNYVELVQGVKDIDGIRYEVVEDIKSNPNYWFEGYQQKGDLFHKPNEKDIQLVSWTKLDQLLGAADGRIANCSLVSKLPMYDILPFAERAGRYRNIFLVISCQAYAARVQAVSGAYRRGAREGDLVLYVTGGAERNYLDARGHLSLAVGDLYEHLPQKVQAAIEFCVRNFDFDRLIKVDDDVFVNFGNLYRALEAAGAHDYVGRRTPTRPGIKPSAVWHYGKVAEGSLHDEVPFDIEGPPECWAGGGIYTMSRAAALHFAEPFIRRLANYHLYEDFMVGDVLARQGIAVRPWDELAGAAGGDWCITHLKDVYGDKLSDPPDVERVRKAVSIHCGSYPPYYRIDEARLRTLFSELSGLVGV